ncbi:MAG: HNH endonuclease [Roseburia sp.]|nr:HNH endonuclease [Roseburia sp.]MCM1279587.1 HNH endonuclease [Robinsoniella sp.]
MGKSIIDGKDLILTEIPVYASNIVETKSNGLAGEIIVSHENIDYFGITGNEIAIKNKKCLELNPENRYKFDKDNLIEYMNNVKNEYISAALFEYKKFKTESWKNVDIMGWNGRLKKINTSKFSCKFEIYIKKTDDKDPKKGTRYYLSGLDSEEYSIIVKYCIIPQYTNIRIKKEENSHGGYNYTFLLEIIGLDDIQSVLKNLQANQEQEYSSKPKEDLFQEARNKSDIAEEYQKGTTVITKVFKRDAAVSAYVKMRANGKCDLCGSNAPFIDKKGNPYLEEHHIVRLADGGADSIDNAVALCPNCHREIHIIGTQEMNNDLKKRIMLYAKLEEKFLRDNE